MDITEKKIKTVDLFRGYINNDEEGVKGYFGKLNIRPPYQREFRYNIKQQKLVIDTILKGYPLNTMYWSVEDDGYEIIDGQQRTLSICEFMNSVFDINYQGNTYYYHSLPEDIKQKFNDYELTVYLCEGNSDEKLEWFKVINIAGETLLLQELLNATYHGPFVSSARKLFSKTGCPAYGKAGDYMKGVPIKQELLETILSWAARHDGLPNGEKYMSLHRNDPNANKLWAYFMNIFTWVETTFTKYRKEMKGLDWALMYDEFGENIYDTVQLETEIHDLMEDDEIMKKSGIYRYVLSGDLRDLSFRTFDKKQKREAYERQNGICVHCGKHFELEEMEADHIRPWKEGGTTVAENCQMLCRSCNRVKGAK